MSRVPTLAEWSRDPQCVDRYLAALDTRGLPEMDAEMLDCLSGYLFKAAHNKVVSATSYASLAARRAADSPDAHEETRQGFLAEALMFETAAHHYRDIAKQRRGRS